MARAIPLLAYLTARSRAWIASIRLLANAAKHREDSALARKRPLPRAIETLGWVGNAMIVLETPYIVIEAELSDFIVLLRRTEAEYPDIATLTADMAQACRVFDELGRERKKLLADLRQGPRRNDPTFEEAMAQIRPRLFRGFRGAAILVRTAVGALQVKRHIREDGAGAEVFHEMDAALDYLRGQSVRGEIPSSVLVSRRTARAPATGTIEAVPRRSSQPPPPPSQRESDLPASGPMPPTRPSRTSS